METRPIETYVYLAGPIANCSDSECSDWRKYLTDGLPGRIILDPMVRDFRGIEGNHTDEIVEGDKKDIANCDVLIANVWQISAGTMMELLFAYDQGLYTIVIVPEGSRVSPWIRYHASCIVNTFDEAIAEVELLEASYYA